MIAPNKEEKQMFKEIFDQQKWYYNCALDILEKDDNIKKITVGKKISFSKFRDLIKKYKYTDDGKEKDLVYDEGRNANPDPGYWKKVHNRTPRGAVKRLVGALNSAISNNDLKFKPKLMKKTTGDRVAYFEDKSFPADLKKVKGRYGYKRKHINLQKLLEQIDLKSLTIKFCPDEDRYYYYFPVPYDWKLKESCNKTHVSADQKAPFVSLDPGIRTFLTGYSNNHTFDLGKESNVLSEILFKIDGIQKLEKATTSNRKKKRLRKQRLRLFRRIKNLVDDLHFKTINFLTENYSVIYLGDFKVKSMVKKKSSKLPRIVKRLMYMYSFYKFKQRLIWKSSLEGSTVLVVNESYTSMTCTNCGYLNRNLGKAKTYDCPCCLTKIDRDINGARNILIKNWPTLQGH